MWSGFVLLPFDTLSNNHVSGASDYVAVAAAAGSLAYPLV